MLFVAIISQHNNPYYCKATISIVALKLSTLAVIAANKYFIFGKSKYGSIFDYIFIK
jgi:hypothetical protein